LPGAEPDTVATSVAEPLERHLGEIADVTEMTSQSSSGQTRITLQFDLNRDINGAARDVQAAINAARADVSTSAEQQSDLPQGQSRRCADDDPGADLEDPDPRPALRRCEQRAAAAPLAARRDRSGIDRRRDAAGRARRAQSHGDVQLRHRPRGRARRARIGQRQQPEGRDREGDHRFQLYTNDQARARRLRPW
jgi:hypothetical protein